MAMDCEALLEYGFSKREDGYYLAVPITDNQFTLAIHIGNDSSIDYKVLDNNFNQEYVLAKNDDAVGSFVGSVKAECEQILKSIKSKCKITDQYNGGQAQRLLSFASSTLNIAPEFLWKNYPTDCVLRRSDNNKWFAVIMTLENASNSQHSQRVELIDLKASPERVEQYLSQGFCHPAYHMNKKHWYTLYFDADIDDETLFSLLMDSYNCVGT